MTIGLAIDNDSFEFFDDAGQLVAERRTLLEEDVRHLEDIGARYAATITDTEDHSATLLALGRELTDFLNQQGSGLDQVLAEANSPVSFEIRAPRDPSPAEWALLNAPFELLVDDRGFLAGHNLRRFSPYRRLGTPKEPPPLDRFRLGLAFMASSPRGQSVLDYEAEETAILRAVEDGDRIDADLWVEESGDPKQLQSRLNDLDAHLPIVHLSCHGLNNWKAGADAEPEPILAMETETGEIRRTPAHQLVQWLNQPRLVFLSACLTARSAGASPDRLPPGEHQKQAPDPIDTGALVAHSYATALVAAGVSAVLGWDGSVDDRAATAFARSLYGALGERADLVGAVGHARRELLSSEDPVVKRDWHMARVWLGPTGGGPLVGGSARRRMTPPNHGETLFLDAKSKRVPVAAHNMFVGRRREIQRSLAALQGTTHGGVLVHGMGRLGKSSLASRIVSRSPGFTPAVVFGTYDALAIVDALRAALQHNKEARELLDQERSNVRDNPAALRYLLVDLLTGPCHQADGSNRPVLLVIDDLEQILQPDPSRVDGLRRFAGNHGQVMSDVLHAFDPGKSDSRLIVTSRFPFDLDGLEAAWTTSTFHHSADRPKPSSSDGKPATSSTGRAS